MSHLNFDHLKQKNCVITGGAGVLGTSISEALASAGVNIAILDRNQEKAQGLADILADRYNIKAIGVMADVLDKELLEAAKIIINKELGPVHFLINGAGGNSPQGTTVVEQLIPNETIPWAESFYGLEVEGFRQVFDLNFLGTLLPTMVFTTEMVEAGKGAVLNISSMSAFKPLTKISAYSAAKASVNNFTEWLAVHLGKTGIRVNALAPGFFLTNQNRFLLTDEATGALTPRGERIISSTPMGKFGDPEDLNGTVLFLLSDLATFITGIIIPVDGGYSAYGGV